MLPVLWSALKRTAMVLGFVMLFQIVVAITVLPVFFQSGLPSLPREMVLFHTFEGNVQEIPNEASLRDPFAAPELTVREIVEALDKAAVDDRVKGFVARMNDGGIGLAHAQEITAALMRFRARGKFAHIYSSSYGDASSGMGRYYLASAFDQIWMQPMGIVTINGVNAEMPFLRNVLDKIGAQPNMYKRKDYKTAYENLTHDSISKENKEMTQRLVNDIRAELVSGIASARRMEPKVFEELVDKGLFAASEAKEAGLINRADYADVLIDDIKEAVTGDRESEDDLFVSLDSYVLAKKGKDEGEPFLAHGKPNVALIYAVGAIMQSDGSGSPVPGGTVAAADKIAPAIMAAAEDDMIEAIVLRIDSPGGSPTASESILRAVEKAQEKGKPVIVSMGPTAASGGYWIAAYADQIFVLPATITGSIGVVGGKFSVGELWDKLGVNWDGVQWGENADMWSLNSKFSPREAERINAMLDAIYHGFITRVAKGRKMGLAEVDEIAGGRVWSGVRAVEIGLADQLGGLDAALDYTAQLLGRDDRSGLDTLVYPKRKTPIEQLIALLEGQVMLGQSVRSNAALLEWGAETLGPLSGAINQVRNPNDFSVYQPMAVR